MCVKTANLLCLHVILNSQSRPMIQMAQGGARPANMVSYGTVRLLTREFQWYTPRFHYRIFWLLSSRIRTRYVLSWVLQVREVSKGDDVLESITLASHTWLRSKGGFLFWLITSSRLAWHRYGGFQVCTWVVKMKNWLSNWWTVRCALYSPIV